MKTGTFVKNYYEAPIAEEFSLTVKGNFLQEGWLPSGTTTSDYDPDDQNPDNDWEN